MDSFTLTDFDRRLQAEFGPQVVLKGLASRAAFHGLPAYLTEYLAAKYVRIASWKKDLASVNKKIKSLLPGTARREQLKDKLLRDGQATIIEEISCSVDLKKGDRWAHVPALESSKVRVKNVLTENCPRLLLGPLWGTAALRYNQMEKEPIEVTSFKPFQGSSPDLAAYRRSRGRFSSDEWLSLMLTSAGYNPAAIRSRRLALLLLCRLVPLVERNVNLVELGPRQTGKTFLLRNVSPQTFLVSGGRASAANLFANLSTKADGILAHYRAVVFDEIAHTTFPDESTVSGLKDYMESGQFSRGSRNYSSDASLFFCGNINVEGTRPAPGYAHLFEPLPSQLREDTAFLDRIHGYLPGWELPKIGPDSLATGVGFVTDLFGELLCRLREEDEKPRFLDLPWPAGTTRRDMIGVSRIGSGLVKLLYPDGRMSPAEFDELTALACELRQRVHDQLATIAPGEFPAKRIGQNKSIKIMTGT